VSPNCRPSSPDGFQVLDSADCFRDEAVFLL